MLVELEPMLRRTTNGWRWRAKPRGYAGDYLSIAQIYDDRASGDGAVGELLDRCCLRLPAARAVQNRRALLAAEIRATTSRCEGRPACVTSLAAGPARELFDVYSRIDEPRAVVSTLIDFDREALDYCALERARHGVDDLVTLVDANLIHVAIGRRTLELAPQDLVYSIGLIDYFDDGLVVKLLDSIYSMLRPGGRVVLGNFHPRNPTRAIMDHVLDWRLVHRDEAAMHALFRASAFRANCSRIFYEPQAINLFAECIRL
jgi:SAM-dependent methyltransferase